jgi:soluble lytic murein transglycosylase-like protein
MKENPLRASTNQQSIARATVALAALVGLPAQACWDDAARRYNVSSHLLHAIAHIESAMDPHAVGRNSDGSRDIGLMQINSRWLPRLARHGIKEHDLFEPCTNIHVGAWILANNVARLGYTWEAVGAYNAMSPTRRDAYIHKVRRQLLSRNADSPVRGRTVATPPVAKGSDRSTQATEP